jgi:zinc transporter ZupT
VDAADAGSIAVFLEHVPYEFENGFHFLKTEDGEDVEHVVEELPAGAHGHGGHEEEEPEATECPWNHEWEWAGIFAVEAGVLDWNAEKGEDGYPDATMIIAVFDTSEASFSALDSAVHAAWDATNAADELEAGGTIPLGRAITLKFNQETWASHFKIVVPANTGGHIAVFAQHFPIEFETNYHYLKAADGADIEPEFEQSGNDCVTETTAATETDDLWGTVIIASFLTVVPTLLSIAFIVAMLAAQIAKLPDEDSIVLAMIHNFASGVIFAAGVFLLLPEGLYLCAVGKTEAGGNGLWGTSIMAGWFFCVIIKHLGQIIAGQVTKVVTVGQVPEVEPDTEKSSDSEGMDWTVCTPILFGDAFHNLADGLVLGTAFKICTSSFGWKLTGITIAHEIPQEISDFGVLITRGRMGPAKATLGNFLSGLTTVLGAIITYSADVSVGVEGTILAAGGGVYLYVAMTELGPAVTDLRKGEAWAASIQRLLAFAFGAIILALILLDHEHCGGEHLLSYDPDAPPEEGGGGGDGHHH